MTIISKSEKLKLVGKSPQTLKPIIFSVASFAQEAKAVAPLGPILGQFNVNSQEFCVKFNKLTIDYAPGLYLPAIVTKRLTAKEFDIKLRKPPLRSLFQAFLSWSFDTDDRELIEERGSIKLEILYDLTLLYSWFHSSTVLQSTRLILANLSSYFNPKNIII